MQQLMRRSACRLAPERKRRRLAEAISAQGQFEMCLITVGARSAQIAMFHDARPGYCASLNQIRNQRGSGIEMCQSIKWTDRLDAYTLMAQT